MVATFDIQEIPSHLEILNDRLLDHERTLNQYCELYRLDDLQKDYDSKKWYKKIFHVRKKYSDKKLQYLFLLTQYGYNRYNIIRKYDGISAADRYHIADTEYSKITGLINFLKNVDKLNAKEYTLTPWEIVLIY